jgi:hypothetical protein
MVWPDFRRKKERVPKMVSNIKLKAECSRGLLFYRYKRLGQMSH